MLFSLPIFPFLSESQFQIGIHLGGDHFVHLARIYDLCLEGVSWCDGVINFHSNLLAQAVELVLLENFYFSRYGEQLAVVGVRSDEVIFKVL